MFSGFLIRCPLKTELLIKKETKKTVFAQGTIGLSIKNKNLGREKLSSKKGILKGMVISINLVRKVLVAKNKSLCQAGIM